MWEDALRDVDEKIKKNIDPKLCKKWLNIITQKLFEAQSALSRHRFKLSKRLKDPMFGRSTKISPSLRKYSLEQNESQDKEERGNKRKKKDNLKENAIMSKPRDKRKRSTYEDYTEPPMCPSTPHNKKTKHEAKGSIKRFSHQRNREVASNREQQASTQVRTKRAISKELRDSKSECNSRNTKKIRAQQAQRTQKNTSPKHTKIQRETRSSTTNKRSHT
jgi:hypothetical protein